MDTVWIHADESCKGNQFQDRPTPGGAAGLVEVWKDGTWERRDYWLSEPDTTNNRMALRSAIEVLRALRRPCRVHLVSDSQYLVKGIEAWLGDWKARGWKRSGGPIENLELWRALDEALSRHEVHPRWTRGHAGHPENEYADLLATRAAEEQTSSGGLVPSGFEAWLDAMRARGAHVDYRASAPPEERFGRA
jgi:ribonuclease HI